jgi:site-specific recombinase XerD
MHGEDIRWDRYPRVASTPQARAFSVRLQHFARRPKTIDAYARHLDRYLASCTDVPGAHWREADEGILLTYLDDLRAGRTRQAASQRPPPPANVVFLSGSQLASTTIVQHVVALRQFYDYLIRAGLRADRTNPLPRGCTGRGGHAPRRGAMRALSRLPWIAPPAIWERLVLHIVLHETARNRALLLVTYDGALRREEVVGLRADDYDRHRALLLVRAATSKSGRDRWVPLTPFSQRALDHYLDRHRRVLVEAYGLAAPGPLFLSESTRNPGRALAPGAVNDVVEALRAAIDLPQLRPHTLRHQRLSALKAAGVPLEDIALFAGHASPETTRLYLHLTPSAPGEKIRAATQASDRHLQRLIQEALDGG